eukprot:Awhi_evm1s10628
MRFSAIVSTTLVGLSASMSTGPTYTEPKNLIFAVTDGMGGTYIQLARAYKGFKEFGETAKDAYSKVEFSIDPYIIGTHRTRSSDSFVTDSAAGAVVFASGERTNNNWIGVRPDGTNLGSIFGAAKHQKDAKVGVTVKSTVTHATPAAFYGNVKHRKSEYRVADQALNFELDVIMGGGKAKFTDRPEEYYTQCDVLYPQSDLLAEFEDLDYDIVYTKQEMEALDPSSGNRVLGLFADSGLYYAVDNDPSNGTEPTLLDMTQHGLKTISEMAKKDDVPFFYHIEASIIDWAGHSNDGAGVAAEVIEWDSVWEHLMAYVDANPDTVLIATSDHETGGLGLGKNGEYWFDPEPLTKQTLSIDSMRKIVLAHTYELDPPSREEVLELGHSLTENYFAIERKNLTEAENDCLYEGLKGQDYNEIQAGLSCVISGRANIGWSTSGHTGSDINIFAYPPRHPVFDPIRGTVNNYEIGLWAAEAFGLDLSIETERVKDIPHGPADDSDENKFEC